MLLHSLFLINCWVGQSWFESSKLGISCPEDCWQRSGWQTNGFATQANRFTCVFLYPHKGRGGPIGIRILLGRVLSYCIHFHLLLLHWSSHCNAVAHWRTGRRPCGTELISNVSTVTEHQRMEIKGRGLGQDSV